MLIISLLLKALPGIGTLLTSYGWGYLFLFIGYNCKQVVSTKDPLLGVFFLHSIMENYGFFRNSNYRFNFF